MTVLTFRYTKKRPTCVLYPVLQAVELASRGGTGCGPGGLGGHSL